MLHVERIQGIVKGRVDGSITLEQAQHFASDLLGYVEGARIRILWDLREARFDLETGEISRLAEFVQQISAPGDQRTAFVVTRAFEFGLVRIFEAFRKTEKAGVAVFRDLEPAMEWLQQ